VVGAQAVPLVVVMEVVVVVAAMCVCIGMNNGDNYAICVN
jgi:hypothetical protein